MSEQPTTTSVPARRVPITPEMMASLRTASGPVISPDGARVAFTLAEWVPGQQRRRASLWVVDGEGDARPVATGEKG